MPARHSAALALVLASGCTSAEVGDPVGMGSGQADAAGGHGSPADSGGNVDPPPDAAPPVPSADAGLVSLSQSSSNDIIGLAAVACFDDNGLEQVNSFYRVFDLNAEGITSSVDVHKITFGVEECVSGGAGLPATVLLHTLQGTFNPNADNVFNLSNLTPLANQQTLIPDVAFPGEGQAGGRLHEVPIEASVPAGSRLVVEVAHAGFGQGQLLLMGANRAAQDGFTFTRAAFCDFSDPTNADTIIDEFGDRVTMHWVVRIDGTLGN
jgi:hypothetical protein